MINIPERKPRIKGLKISQTPEKLNITGDEFIPYQDGDVNGRFKAGEINKLNIFEFSPKVKEDGKISAREYLDILTAIRSHKLIYIPKEDGTGKSIATEIRVKAGDIHLELLDYKLEEDKSKIAEVITESVDVTSDLEYIRTKHVTPTFTVAGNGKHLLADNGQYISIDDWFLKDINFEGSNNTTAVYGLLASKIILGQKDTDSVSWEVSDESASTEKDYTVNLKLKIDLATWDKDGLMPRKDKWRLDVKIPKVLHKLEAEDEKLHLKDAELQENINDNYNKFIDFKYLQSLKNDEFSNAIEDEITRAKEAEEVLTKKLETESTERKAKDDEYQQNFDDIKDKWEAGDKAVRDYVDELKNQVGKANGLATLDKSGKVPTDLLPAYVDDVLEYTHKDHNGHEADPAATYFPEHGETGKIYVDTTSGITYRWSGTQYVEISSSLALGETDSTAYKGSEGNKNRMALRSLPNSMVTDFVDGSQEYTDTEVKFKYKKSRRKTSTDVEVGTDDVNLGFTTPEELEVTIAASTHDKAGVMTALQHNNLAHLHEELGSIDDLGNKVSTIPKRLMTHIDPAVQEADSVHMDYMTYVQNKDGADKETAGDTAAYVKGKYERQDHTRITLNAATDDKAGVLKSTDYKKLDSIPDDLVSTIDYASIKKAGTDTTDETPYDTILIDYKAFKKPGSGRYTSLGESALEVLKIASTAVSEGTDTYVDSLTGWKLSGTKGTEEDNTANIVKQPVLTFDTVKVPTKTRFDAEVTRTAAKEVELGNRITREQLRAMLAEGALKDAINAEKDRATSKEEELKQSIETEKSRAEGKETELKNSIEQESTRAKAEEVELEAKIDKNEEAITLEKTRATDAETKIQQLVTKEEQRAEAAEHKLETLITDEKGRATKEEADLQKLIDELKQSDAKLDTHLEQLDTKLEEGLEEEKNRATLRENELELKITEETNRATQKETKLQDEIDDINGSIKTVQDTLQLQDQEIKKLLDDAKHPITVETTGTGNAVTTGSVTGTKVTLTKGKTFVDVDNPLTVSGTKTFTQALLFDNNADICFKNDATTNHGITFYNNDWDAILGGVGMVNSEGYIGWGATPSNDATSLKVGDAKLTYKNHKIWHEGNDGTGSNLDADKLDGHESSEFIFANTKGLNNGVATLDAQGKIPSSLLPSFVDDVLEYDHKDANGSGTSFPATGEAGKIYVDKATNLTYRWSGSAYVEISKSLALGETESTAFSGKRGKDLETKVTSLESKDKEHDTKLQELESKITANKSEADTKYVKKAGDTMTGGLTINQTTGDSLTLNKTDKPRTITFKGSDTNTWSLTHGGDAGTDTHLDIKHGSTDVATFASTGNVGIGTTAPDAKLHVSGNAHILAALNVNDSITASGLLISNAAAGTAPLKVTSTTVVTNLNADLLDGHHYNEIETKYNSLNSTLESVKANPITLTNQGSGNAVDEVTLSGKTLTVKKNKTYVDTTTDLTIGGNKKFSNPLKVEYSGTGDSGLIIKRLTDNSEASIALISTNSSTGNRWVIGSKGSTDLNFKHGTSLNDTDTSATSVVTFSEDGDITANKFKKKNGTSNQILLADGTTLDKSTLVTTSGQTSTLSNYVTLNTSLTITGLKTFKTTTPIEYTSTGSGLVIKKGTDGKEASATFIATTGDHGTRWVIGPKIKDAASEDFGFYYGTSLLTTHDNAVTRKAWLTKDGKFTSSSLTAVDTGDSFANSPYVELLSNNKCASRLVMDTTGNRGDIHVMNNVANSFKNAVTDYRTVYAAKFIIPKATNDSILLGNGETTSKAKFVTTDTAQTITGVKTFTQTLLFLNSDLKLSGASTSLARGLLLTDGSFGTVTHGFGSYNNNAVIGWGNTYYQPANSLTVGTSKFTYKGNDVLYKGHNANSTNGYETYLRLYVGLPDLTAGGAPSNPESDGTVNIVDWAKKIGTHKPGLYTKTYLSFGNNKKLKLSDSSTIINSEKYSCLDFQYGNINEEWRLNAFLFLPATYTTDSTLPRTEEGYMYIDTFTHSDDNNYRDTEKHTWKYPPLEALECIFVKNTLTAKVATTTATGNGSVTYDKALNTLTFSLPKGDKGDKGDRGEKGPKGDTGANGATGPLGPKGEQGERGPAGVAGPTGPKGDKGDTGPAGPTGPTGPLGPAGAAGAKGATGPLGPAGKIWKPSVNSSGVLSWTLTDSSSTSSPSADLSGYYVKKAGDTMSGALTAPHFYKSSDARLKTNIEDLPYTLDQICAIPTISFDLDGKHQIGTTAQGLEAIGINELVTETDTLKSTVKGSDKFESFIKDGEEYIKVKKVEYDTLSVLAILGIKLLKAEIDKLKEELRYGRNGN